VSSIKLFAEGFGPFEGVKPLAFKILLGLLLDSLARKIVRTSRLCNRPAELQKEPHGRRSRALTRG